ncbi:MAG: GNAT family N-acetyltransferase [Anaerolineaceae bacterium]|nr:MAG: GNAT family N-acetyltransferase [Anaerolineaceae bacterium]
MINYINCSIVRFEDVYNAFQMGFSDYFLKMEMPIETFQAKFFGPEGNQLDKSYIAYDDVNPVGLILGGIRNYENIRTLRCGTLCVHPDYRDQGIAKELYKYHKQIALENNCKQMFLEVMVVNNKAINFYKKLGYEIIYNLNYYRYHQGNSIDFKLDSSIKVQEITFEDVKALSVYLADIHINWQNSLDYIELLDNLTYYGVYDGTKLVGALCISLQGNIYIVWTKPSYRHKHIAASMIATATRKLNLSELSISLTNNASLINFLLKHNFKKQELAQYEMYLPL